MKKITSLTATALLSSTTLFAQGHLGAPTLSVDPQSPTAAESFVLEIAGDWLDGCTPTFDVWRLENGALELTLEAGPVCQGACTAAITSYDASVTILEGLPAGIYPIEARWLDRCDGSPIEAVSFPALQISSEQESSSFVPNGGMHRDADGWESSSPSKLAVAFRSDVDRLGSAESGSMELAVTDLAPAEGVAATRCLPIRADRHYAWDAMAWFASDSSQADVSFSGTWHDELDCSDEGGAVDVGTTAAVPGRWTSVGPETSQPSPPTAAALRLSIEVHNPTDEPTDLTVRIDDVRLFETCRGLRIGSDHCLNDRFRVDAHWRDFEAREGLATVSSAKSDSGLFTFFDESNWELMVKVLDGCGTNGHFWVFAAGSTNVEYTLTVTDTQTDATRSYFNSLGAASDAVTDTLAFPCS